MIRALAAVSVLWVLPAAAQAPPAPMQPIGLHCSPVVDPDGRQMRADGTATASRTLTLTD